MASSLLSNNPIMKLGHLQENKVGYWEHWRFAMKLSIALFIHAWLPDVLTDYASKKILEQHKKKK